ncbi:GatB/YqeY domain-containing protein [Neptunomonas japonica]|uniref:GatB/YqeY domain-containing protein n=1 Tax=Neptunomonas japonica TaxID=417574 RepID=UPI0003F90278|nr:GatB/YqeY domain-containing protein [Neptunomonas japonica]
MPVLKKQITEAMKAAMRAKEKALLGTIRLILAEIKRIEVDERIELDDARIIAVLDKMSKQRRDSISQYDKANRTDLADIERQELEVIKTYLPQSLTDEEISTALDEAIAATGASGAQDMGKLMAELKPKVQGRADMGMVSKLVKERLAR